MILISKMFQINLNLKVIALTIILIYLTFSCIEDLEVIQKFYLIHTTFCAN